MHREKRRAGLTGADPPVSLTGLSPQVRVMLTEMEREMGQLYRLSLTGLRRRLRRKTLKSLGKMAREARDCGT